MQSKSKKELTVGDVIVTMSEHQREVLYFLIEEAYKRGCNDTELKFKNNIDDCK